MLDEDGALVLASAARHAIPHRVEADSIDQRQLLHVAVAVAVRHRRLVGGFAQGVPDEERRLDLPHLLLDGGTHVVHDLLRREFLAGEVRRADDLASPALGAGVRVEHLLPAEIVDDAGAEALRRLEIADGLQLARWLDAAEEDVEGHGEQVRVLAVRQVVEEDEEVREVRVPPEVEKALLRALRHADVVPHLREAVREE